MSNLPNFLIVGTAKGGTTSLYHFVKQHPKIFMSPVKEPKFISAQFLTFPFKGIGDFKVEKNIYKNLSDYKRLFDKVKDEDILGEASTDTLYYHQESIKIIKKILGDPKILIVLRNPVDRAYSNYLHLVKEGREELCFEDALESEESRIKNNWDYFWHYKSLGLYFEQVKDFMDNFSNVQILCFEQLKDDILRLLTDIFKFLGVDSDYKISNTKVPLNVSGVPKNNYVQKLLNSHNILFRTGRKIMNNTPLEGPLANFSESLRKRNLRKPKLKLETRRKLVEFYRKDVLNLSHLIDKDLSNWLIIE